MLYRRNVGFKESVARVLGGALMVGGALTQLGMTPLGWALIAGGALAALTGVLGFCPACAMAGRKPLRGPR
jgi:hypothetical protein